MTTSNLYFPVMNGWEQIFKSNLHFNSSEKTIWFFPGSWWELTESDDILGHALSKNWCLDIGIFLMTALGGTHLCLVLGASGNSTIVSNEIKESGTL